MVDFQQNSLHVLNYSTPIHAKMPLSELREAPFCPTGASGLDSIQNFLLQTGVGILSGAQSDAAISMK